ncbi:MAG: hypothetical protein P8L39_10405, partial [Halioglobus sp.]|nr:hypothetical protein [Halioglobus sp.]
PYPILGTRLSSDDDTTQPSAVADLDRINRSALVRKFGLETGSAIDSRLIRSALRLSVWRLRASLQNAVTTEAPAEVLTEILS